MQAEAGQALEQIIRRKERERQASGGRFFWGVGNAPSVLINSLARMAKPVEVVFSKMKTKPKTIDKHPATTVIWRQYIDSAGYPRPVPAHTLITSRGDSAGGRKRVHYALECFSAKPLYITTNPKVFDPSSYRNAGGTGAGVGASQVTSLLVTRKKADGGPNSAYGIDMRAELIGSYWVKLIDPLPLNKSDLELIEKVGKEHGDLASITTELRTKTDNTAAKDGFQRLL